MPQDEDHAGDNAMKAIQAAQDRLERRRAQGPHGLPELPKGLFEEIQQGEWRAEAEFLERLETEPSPLARAQAALDGLSVARHRRGDILAAADRAVGEALALAGDGSDPRPILTERRSTPAGVRHDTRTVNDHYLLDVVGVARHHAALESADNREAAAAKGGMAARMVKDVFGRALALLVLSCLDLPSRSAWSAEAALALHAVDSAPLALWANRAVREWLAPPASWEDSSTPLWGRHPVKARWTGMTEADRKSVAGAVTSAAGLVLFGRPLMGFKKEPGSDHVLLQHLKGPGVTPAQYLAALLPAELAALHDPKIEPAGST
jgi:hypothetical protein